MGAHYRSKHKSALSRKRSRRKVKEARYSVASLGEHFKLSKSEVVKLKKFLKAI